MLNYIHRYHKDAVIAVITFSIKKNNLLNILLTSHGNDWIGAEPLERNDPYHEGISVRSHSLPGGDVRGVMTHLFE